MNEQVMTQTHSQQHIQEERAGKKWLQHAELIAALVSGVLILAAWFFTETKGLSVTLYILAFLIGGFAKAKEGIEDTIETKALNVELLMIFAAVGSALIGYWAEGAVLIFIFSLSGALETYTMNKSSRDLTSLMKLEPEEATLLADGREKRVPAAELKIGDMIVIKPGERVAADGIIESGVTSSMNRRLRVKRCRRKKQPEILCLQER